MDLYAACDICGHRHVFSEDRQGRRTKCKSCGMPFEISEANYYDPESSEIEADEPDDEDPLSNVAVKVARTVGHGLTAVVTMALLAWMSSLFFRSPQQAVASLHVAQPNGGISNPGIAPQQAPSAPWLPGSRGRRRDFPQPNSPQPGVTQPGFPPPGFPQPGMPPQAGFPVPGTPQFPPPFHPPAPNSPAFNPPTSNPAGIPGPRIPKRPFIPTPQIRIRISDLRQSESKPVVRRPRVRDRPLMLQTDFHC